MNVGGHQERRRPEEEYDSSPPLPCPRLPCPPSSEEEEERCRGLREAFAMYEVKGEGCITPASLMRMLARLGSEQGIEECRAMIRRFDLHGDGVVCFDEFKAMLDA